MKLILKSKEDFEKRFERVEWMSNTKTTELAKVLRLDTFLVYSLNFHEFHLQFHISTKSITSFSHIIFVI